MSPWLRFVLWDYERGSLGYDVLCVALALVLLATPAGMWADPMAVGP